MVRNAPERSSCHRVRLIQERPEPLIGSTNMPMSGRADNLD